MIQRFVRWLSRRSLENPSVSLSDPDAWNEAFGAGSESSSGIKVSRETALSYPAIWRADDLISSDVAKLPRHVFKRDGDGWDRDLKHPVSFLIRVCPNPAAMSMTAFTFWKTLVSHRNLEGNGFALITRRGDGTPVALQNLDPNAVIPVVEKGILRYGVQMDGDLFKVHAQNMLHIKGPSKDGIRGYGILNAGKDSIGLGLGLQKYQARFFKNNAQPGMLICFPPATKAEAAREFIKSWNSAHRGEDNWHKVAAVTGGGEPKPFTQNARDSQLNESRQFELREVANWFGVPSHKVGDTTRTSYNSLEQENQAYLDQCLDGILCSIEAECRLKLLSHEELTRDTHNIEFVREALVRADIGSRYAALFQAIGGPFLTVNEGRGAENRKPIEGGNELLSPLNMGGAKSTKDVEIGEATTEEDGNSKEKEKDGNAKEDARRDLWIQTESRFAKRVQAAARRAAKKPDKFEAWLNQMHDEHLTQFAEAMTPVFRLHEPGSDATDYCRAVLNVWRHELTYNHEADLWHN